MHTVVVEAARSGGHDTPRIAPVARRRGAGKDVDAADQPGLNRGGPQRGVEEQGDRDVVVDVSGTGGRSAAQIDVGLTVRDGNGTR